MPAKKKEPPERGAAHVDKKIKGKGGKGVDTWQERHSGATWSKTQTTNRSAAVEAGWNPSSGIQLGTWIKRHPGKAAKAKLETPGPTKGPLPMPKVPPRKKKAAAKRRAS